MKFPRIGLPKRVLQGALVISATAFVAVDSKIGDIYLGAARGSGNVYNLFLQLGRRFSF